MGSEGPTPALTVHITGFKKFQGVGENPTETIVNNLQDYMNNRGLPKGLVLGSCTVLETAGQGAICTLYQTLQSAVSKDNAASNSGAVIWVHFGVNSGASRFAIEYQAINEATFRQTSLPVEDITSVWRKWAMRWRPQMMLVVLCATMCTTFCTAERNEVSVCACSSVLDNR